MGSHFFMIQDVAKIDDINSFIGKIKMKEPFYLVITNPSRLVKVFENIESCLVY
jgi:hypothetical protein